MSAMPMDPSPERRERSGLLADAVLRSRLLRFVRGRVPAAEADDIVQATLAEALASRHAPDEAGPLQRWVFGIARHKCTDFYRHRGREAPAPEPIDGDVPAEGEPLSARDLLRWAERELPDGEQAASTLDWMLREAGGDKLESIADEERIPAPRVRQRVARMRRHYRARWAAQVAAIVAGVLLVVVAAWVWRELDPQPRAELEPEKPRPVERATELRRRAFEACEERDWERCLDRLDDAARLDPAGNTKPEVERARRAAVEALDTSSEPPPEADDESSRLDDGKDDVAPSPPPAPQKPSPKPDPKAPEGEPGPSPKEVPRLQNQKQVTPPKGFDKPELTQSAVPPPAPLGDVPVPQPASKNQPPPETVLHQKAHVESVGQ